MKLARTQRGWVAALLFAAACGSAAPMPNMEAHDATVSIETSSRTGTRYVQVQTGKAQWMVDVNNTSVNGEQLDETAVPIPPLVCASCSVDGGIVICTGCVPKKAGA